MSNTEGACRACGHVMRLGFEPAAQKRIDALEARCAALSELLEDGMSFVEVGADVAGTGLTAEEAQWLANAYAKTGQDPDVCRFQLPASNNGGQAGE